MRDELIDDREGNFAAGQDAGHDDEANAPRTAKHPARIRDEFRFHEMSSGNIREHCCAVTRPKREFLIL